MAANIEQNAEVCPNVRPAPDRGGGGSPSNGAPPGGEASGPLDGISGQSAFVYGEALVAQKSGVHEKILAKIRRKNLLQGRDWDLNGLHVCYSEAGLEHLVANLTGNGQTIDVKLLKPEPPPAQEALVMGKVKCFYLNPRLVGIELDDGQVVRVRVRESKNFELGMEVPLRQTGANYDLARRLPRFPGRW